MTGPDNSNSASPMEFYKAIYQILRPIKPGTYGVLFSALSLVFVLTALLSLLTNSSIPFTGITVSFSGIGASSPPTMRNSTTIDEVKEEGGGSKCDIFDGSWVVDEDSAHPHRRPSYGPGKCPFVEDGFNCFGNGRLDLNYTLLWWQPSGCSLPRSAPYVIRKLHRCNRWIDIIIIYI